MSTRDEEIRVKVTGADQSERALDKVGGTAKVVGESVAGMGRESEKASKKVDELGDEAKGTASDLSRLDRQIAETKAAMATLNTEFERTGDAKVSEEFDKQAAALAKMETRARSVAKINKQIAADAAKATPRADRVDPLDAIEKHYAARDRAERIRRRIEDDAAGARRGRAGRLSRFLGIGESAGQDASGALGELGGAVAGSPILLGVGAAAAVPAATFLGAAAGGAVGLGAAAGGAALGLAGAFANDPEKYAAAWGVSTDKIKKRWLESSAAFGDELDGVLKVADRTLTDLPVERVLALSQSFVMPLAEGAGGGLTAAADGFADFLANAQPIVDVVGPKLANLGGSVGDAMRAIGEGSEGGAAALGDLVDAIGYTIRATGVLIMGFENTYKAVRDFEKSNFEFIDKVPVVGAAVDWYANRFLNLGSTTIVAARAFDDVNASAPPAARGIASVATEAARAAAEAGGLNGELTETRNTMLSLADASIGLAQGWLTLKTELADGAKTFDLTKQAGIDNQKAILDQVEAAERLREQQIATGKGTADAIAEADAAYDANIEKIKQAAYAAHFNKDQVDALITSLGAIPPAKSTTVTVPGMAKALADGVALGAALNNIDGTYTAHVQVAGLTQALIDAARLAATLPHYASGGSVASAGFAVVGENGPEIRWLGQGDHMTPAQQTRDFLGGASTGGGSRAGSSIGVAVMPGADSYVGQLVQKLIDAGMIQAFVNGEPVTTRR